MMRRFSRRRRGGAREGGGAAPIDTAVLSRILELEIVPAVSLEPHEADEVPAGLAVVGSGESKRGGRIVITYSPRNATHAVVAALSVGARLAAEAEADAPAVYAVAPEWSEAARRVLGLVGKLPFELTAVPAPALAADGARVQPEPGGGAAILTPAQIAGHLAAPGERDLFLRASRGLEGLAAKHGAALRGHGRSLDLVLLARRVAELCANDDGSVSLTTLLPQRSTTRLTVDGLSNTLDALEGQLRKRLNDRRVRDGEEGLRSRAIGEFRTWHSLRAWVPWPLGGNDHEVIDWVGVDVEGRPVIGAARDDLALAELAAILESAVGLRPLLPAVLAQAAPPVLLDAARLVVGGKSIGAGVGRVLESLTMAHELFEIRGGASLELRAIAAGEAPSRETRPRRPRRGPQPSKEAGEDGAADGGEDERSVDAEDSETGGGSGRNRSRSRRGRGRRGRGRGDSVGPAGGAGVGARDAEPGDGSGESNADDERPAARFEEVSLFDLDEEPADRGAGARSRRRRRGSRRPRTGSGDRNEGDRADGDRAEGDRAEGDRGDEGSASAGADVPAGASDSGPSPAGPSLVEEASDDDADLVDEILTGVDDEGLEEVPDLEPAEPAYEDEEGDGEEASESGPVRRRAPVVEVVQEAPQLPRRRSAILACADRDSIVAATLIARDVRMVEGLWVYPQDELMSFFRGVTTDLRDDTPIYVVGFQPKPAIEVLQTVSLYRDRLQWFDHHDWPPEDLQALRDVLGEDAVHLTPGAGSSLPSVLACCSRRSRFTDKLVDLVAARFTEHDYERWGRLWWWRLGEMTGRTGDRRADLEALLSGRPSDLAREAAGAETPPIPAEVEYVSQRDFRLVHFSGYGLVVLEVPDPLDLHLTARVARERYGAQLALTLRPGSEQVLFSGDELAGRRSLDLGALVEHIANKLEWVERLTDADHVSRMRVRQLDAHPERLDEIVSEIAMGRSILER